MEKQQRQQVEKNMREAREKLESEMEDAYHEHQANMLRQGKCCNVSALIAVSQRHGYTQHPLCCTTTTVVF